jgi:hypothetical protein
MTGSLSWTADHSARCGACRRSMVDSVCESMESEEEGAAPAPCSAALASDRICPAEPRHRMDLATRNADVLQHEVRHSVELRPAVPYPVDATHEAHAPADEVQERTDCGGCTRDSVHVRLPPTLSGANCRAARDRLWRFCVGAIVCVGVEKALGLRVSPTFTLI